MKEITVKNYVRNRKFGWGYSLTPTGEDAYSIEVPSRPYYEGTIKQIFAARDEDRTWQAYRNANHNTAWFYGGKRILQSRVWTNLEDFYTESGEEREDDVPLGHLWVWGFHFPGDGATEIRIRVED